MWNICSTPPTFPQGLETVLEVGVARLSEPEVGEDRTETMSSGHERTNTQGLTVGVVACTRTTQSQSAFSIPALPRSI